MFLENIYFDNGRKALFFEKIAILLNFGRMYGLNNQFFIS